LLHVITHDIHSAYLTDTKLDKCPHQCNISNKNFPRFFSIRIINLKAGSKVTERPREDAVDISTNELQTQIHTAIQLITIIPRLQDSK